MKKYITISLISSGLLFNCHSAIYANADYWKAEDYYLNSSSQKNAAKDLLSFVSLKGNETILDVGCGDGKITAEISQLVPEGSVVGIDKSQSMISFAQNNYPEEMYSNLKFILQDAQELTYKDAFDDIFSFTTLQWIENHNAFLFGAYAGLKNGGTLAVTMPMGLPLALEQAVKEVIASPQWKLYFKHFSTGWNFVTKNDYHDLLVSHGFTVSRLEVVPQKDVFPSRKSFEKFVSQWFPYTRALPPTLKKIFLKRVIDRYLELETPFPNGEVHFKIKRLEVVATKP